MPFLRSHSSVVSDAPIALEDQTNTYHPFGPSAPAHSAAPFERPCSEAEVLHFMLQSEASRQEMERSTDDLKQLIEQSARATREAQNATRVRSDFLARVSHEIRTPLNGIIGMTDLLLSRNLAAQDRDCVETIRSSGEALLAVINDVLDFSKLEFSNAEAGRLELECANFQPAYVIQQALQIIQGAAASKALFFKAEISPSMPSLVAGDMVRLRQVFLNLLANAVKFTDAGTIVLKAELLCTTDSGSELRFSVADSGIGISEDQQKKLFQPFTQASASTAQKYGGTGLGLAICKQIVELMGGNIGVVSSPGAGALFWFTVKVLAPEKIVSSPAVTAAVETDKFRILLVDDNPINQKVAGLMLKKLGYRAHVARDGRHAIKLLERETYDLILMDVLMPEMDGLEATQIIRALPAPASQVPIIAMTAGAVKDRQACFKAGMTDYLAKPVREPELREKLQHWLAPVTT